MPSATSLRNNGNSFLTAEVKAWLFSLDPPSSPLPNYPSQNTNEGGRSRGGQEKPFSRRSTCPLERKCRKKQTGTGRASDHNAGLHQSNESFWSHWAEMARSKEPPSGDSLTGGCPERAWPQLQGFGRFWRSCSWRLSATCHPFS